MVLIFSRLHASINLSFSLYLIKRFTMYVIDVFFEINEIAVNNINFKSKTNDLFSIYKIPNLLFHGLII